MLIVSLYVITGYSWAAVILCIASLIYGRVYASALPYSPRLMCLYVYMDLGVAIITPVGTCSVFLSEAATEARS